MDTLSNSTEQMWSQTKKTTSRGPLLDLLSNIQNTTMILQQKTPISPEDFIIQQKETKNIQAERMKKENILRQLLHLTPEQAQNRPNLEEVNPENLNEITAYAARQNLACAFGCCADEDTAEDVENTVNILKNNIPKGKFIHLTLYPEDNWEAIVLQNPQYASQYFIVSIEDEPQNKEEQLKMQNEFKKVFNQLKQKNAQK